MNHVSVEEAKSYANIYFTEKDAEIEKLVASAEDYVARLLNYDTLSHADLLVDQGSPPPDSPGAEILKPGVDLLVKMAFNQAWQLREIQVTGTIVSENPEFIRLAHLYRRNLGV